MLRKEDYQIALSIAVSVSLLLGCDTDEERRRAEMLARQAALNNSNPAEVGGNIVDMQQTAQAQSTLDFWDNQGGTPTP